ncbi:hypothetical protein PHYBOEH_001304 [Phytophthora boehmeriae]|uniref:BZIP domain-containing protein n=1 Tax=Phytophthora boehmeriae TaxID=109152 RepID=A0A8T1WZY9_9STRA|nr:hypothetical protein PHYBOEH_001304 [Phytophthora boehmeriae]
MTASSLPPYKWTTDNVSAATVTSNCVIAPGATLKWTIDDQTEWKRRKHRATMVEFRRKKKLKTKYLQSEYERLVLEMQRCVDAVQNHAVFEEDDGQVKTKLIKLVLELEELRTQNITLRKAIGSYDAYRALLREVNSFPLGIEEPFVADTSEQEGWWVHFSNGEPPFYFHPFPPEQLTVEINAIEPDLSPNAYVGTFFGWKAYRETMLPDAAQGSVLPIRVQFNKRLRCSIDDVQKVSCEKEASLCPLVLMPLRWGSHQRNQVSIETLQSFEPDCRIIVINLPGPTHLRYLCLAQRAQWKLAGGRRKLAFSLRIIDSEANRRSRDAAMSHEGVEWAIHGGAELMITEVDDTTADVSSAHWVSCQNELHAKFLMVQWMQFIVQWEQAVVPSNLLTC